ncbi:hypothetical protein EFY87_18155 [Flexivirga caeni]|uniref:Uncharacterized protein n=1 Tax=Flexivirga caeni TaxID=2294115 RepID=A0A3M9LYE8_9MICO|nr:hypothetical protein EFY87_18155 [Flexivirga caeni]
MPFGVSLSFVVGCTRDERLELDDEDELGVWTGVVVLDVGAADDVELVVLCDGGVVTLALFPLLHAARLTAPAAATAPMTVRRKRLLDMDSLR